MQLFVAVAVKPEDESHVFSLIDSIIHEFSDSKIYEEDSQGQSCIENVWRIDGNGVKFHSKFEEKDW